MKRWLVMVPLILGLGVGLALIHSSRQPHGAKLNVRLVAVTNDLAGTSFAVFALSAVALIRVDAADPIIELRNQPPIIGGGWIFGTRLSPGGRPATVKVAVPKTQDEWRVAFYYYPLGLRQRVTEVVTRLFGIFGMQMRGRSITLSTAHSDWMAPTSQINWLESDWLKP
jgi:hypothetical protein